NEKKNTKAAKIAALQIEKSRRSATSQGSARASRNLSIARRGLPAAEMNGFQREPVDGAIAVDGAEAILLSLGQHFQEPMRIEPDAASRMQANDNGVPRLARRQDGPALPVDFERGMLGHVTGIELPDLPVFGRSDLERGRIL